MAKFDRKKKNVNKKMKKYIFNKSIKNIVHYKYKFSLLEKRLVIKFLLEHKFHYGPLYYPQIRPFCIGTRRNYVIFNLFMLLSQIRKMLYMVHLHSYTKELVVILAANQQRGFGHRKFYLFTRWVPGFLTNYKRLMRRALAETRYGRLSKLSQIYLVLFM
jgi:ribosomal protein S2